MLTYREFIEFSRYCVKQPIDDRANFHLPIAMLAALYKVHHQKAESDPPSLEDFLVFGGLQEPERQEPQDVDDQLRHIAFMFKA
jgi:hypothetical protein